MYNINYDLFDNIDCWEALKIATNQSHAYQILSNRCVNELTKDVASKMTGDVESLIFSLISDSPEDAIKINNILGHLYYVAEMYNEALVRYEDACKIVMELKKKAIIRKEAMPDALSHFKSMQVLILCRKQTSDKNQIIVIANQSYNINPNYALNIIAKLVSFLYYDDIPKEQEFNTIYKQLNDIIEKEDFNENPYYTFNKSFIVCWALYIINQYRERKTTGKRDEIINIRIIPDCTNEDDDDVPLSVLKNKIKYKPRTDETKSGDIVQEISVEKQTHNYKQINVFAEQFKELIDFLHYLNTELCKSQSKNKALEEQISELHKEREELNQINANLQETHSLLGINMEAMVETAQSLIERLNTSNNTYKRKKQI